jgi:uncharacterized membrane protein YGL010W
MRFDVPAPMRARLAEYEGFHRAWGNELCHFLGVPSIIVGAASLLALLPLAAVAEWRVTLAELVATAIIAFYVMQARWLGVVTGVVLAGLVLAGRTLPWTIGLGLFLGGWALQFVGHVVYEHRSPAFLRNLLHLLVGPAWLVERAFGRVAR